MVSRDTGKNFGVGVVSLTQVGQGLGLCFQACHLSEVPVGSFAMSV